MKNADQIFDTQAERIADMFKVSDELYSKAEKIAYLHKIAAETSASPFTLYILSERVRALVGDEIYNSVFPQVVYR